MKKNLSIILVVFLLASVTYNFYMINELKVEKMMGMKQRVISDSLRSELEKLNKKVEEDYQRAQRVYLETLKLQEEARKKYPNK